MIGARNSKLCGSPVRAMSVAGAALRRGIRAPRSSGAPSGIATVSVSALVKSAFARPPDVLVTGPISLPSSVMKLKFRPFRSPLRWASCGSLLP